MFNAPTSARNSEKELTLSLEAQDQARRTGLHGSPNVSRTKTFFIIFFLSGVTFLSSMGSGMFLKRSTDASLNTDQAF